MQAEHFLSWCFIPCRARYVLGAVAEACLTRGKRGLVRHASSFRHPARRELNFLSGRRGRAQRLRLLNNSLFLLIGVGFLQRIVRLLLPKTERVLAHICIEVVPLVKVFVHETR